MANINPYDPDMYYRRLNRLHGLDSAAEAAPAMTTGGNLPPQVAPVVQTGGNLPPQAVTTQAPPMSTPLPPLSEWTNPAPPMSTPLPPIQMPTQPAGTAMPASVLQALNLPAINGQQYVAGLVGSPPAQQFSPIDIINQLRAAFGVGDQPSANSMVQGTVDGILNPNNAYIQRARQRALDQAGQRGLLNSSIAQGAAEGAAIDAAMPLIQESLGIQNRRETQNFNAAMAERAQAMGLISEREAQAFQQQESQLNRTQEVNNALLSSELNQRQMAYDYNFRNQLQSNQTAQQDWLNNQQFTRDFNASIATMPIRGAYDLAQMIQQYALEDPETYTPQIISGMTNFFQQNMLSVLQQYFPSLYGATSGNGG